MDFLANAITLIATIVPLIVSIFTIKYQANINKENNEQQLRLNKQSNDYNLKQKQLETYYSTKTSILNDYLDTLSQYLNNTTNENFIRYQSIMSKSCMYVSKEVYDYIIDINDLIKVKRFDDIEDLFEGLLYQLNIEAQDYNKNN